MSKYVGNVDGEMTNGETSGQRKAKQCKYALYVRDDTVTRFTHEHTCSLPNPERTKALEQASWMKERVTSIRDAPRAIIAQATAGLQTAELAQLKSYGAAQRSIEIKFHILLLSLISLYLDSVKNTCLINAVVVVGGADGDDLIMIIFRIYIRLIYRLFMMGN
jgi:hypothetical protein